MRNLNLIRATILIGFVFLLAAACLPTTVEPPVELTIPTVVVPAQSTDAPPAIAPTLRADLPAPPTFQPGGNPSIQPGNQGTPEPTAMPEPTATPYYQLAFVAADDTLNVRSGPGVDNDVVGELSPEDARAQITGAGQLVDDSTWVPIAADDAAGWVNGRFLTQSVDGEAFCQDEAVADLLMELATAVTNQDGDLLAQLTHPERGLRLRYSWWNPEVLLDNDEVSNIFTSSTSYEWGVEDGSGNSIVGSFSQEILPLLQEDLLLADDELACDEIRHGSTAGSVRLPDEYQHIHYYSFHRPGTDEFSGMNWGTWVVGIERWQGEYYLSFLVHFAWEI